MRDHLMGLPASAGDDWGDEGDCCVCYPLGMPASVIHDLEKQRERLMNEILKSTLHRIVGPCQTRSDDAGISKRWGFMQGLHTIIAEEDTL